MQGYQGDIAEVAVVDYKAKKKKKKKRYEVVNTLQLADALAGSVKYYSQMSHFKSYAYFA